MQASPSPLHPEQHQLLWHRISPEKTYTYLEKRLDGIEPRWYYLTVFAKETQDKERRSRRKKNRKKKKRIGQAQLSHSAWPMTPKPSLK